MTSVPMTLVCLRYSQLCGWKDDLERGSPTKISCAFSKSSLTSAICRRRVGEVGEEGVVSLADDMSSIIMSQADLLICLTLEDRSTTSYVFDFCQPGKLPRIEIDWLDTG